ncbi:MAG: penicillin-binding protein [Verrucomicrobiales bacterium]|nr:penicillin-binding protein [Verrucomicrobiales bacterium]
MPRLILLSLCVLIANLVRADQVDDYINSQMQSLSVPGMALTVLKNGKEIKTAGYGVANLELDVPATRESVFELGAISSQFTAGGIVLLQEAGKLSFDDPISKFLPNTPSIWSGVTIRHCLTHTSGLKSYAYMDGFEFRYHLTQQDFIRLIAEYPLEFEPGSKFSYSPTDYTLLGHIIASASGQSYWSYLQAKIFRPLKMNSTYERNPLNIIPNRANGYVKLKTGGFENRDYDLTDMFAAANTATTVVDFAKWDNALNGKTLFSDENRKLFWSSSKLEGGANNNTGFMFRIGKFRGNTEHSLVGATGGFCSAYLRFPETGYTIFILVNDTDANMSITLAHGVANFYITSK